MNENDSSPQDEPRPAEETAQGNKKTGEEEAEIPALPPVVQSAEAEAPHSYSTESEEETDRKQDESIASLAKQTDWVRFQALASTFLGVMTLAVLVYHGWVMGRQSQAMTDQTAIMKGQLESMNSGSVQTQQMIAAMQKQAEAATAQAGTSQALADQNKDLVIASLAQAEAAKQSVGAALASARAAEKGVQIARESFYIGDRPYIMAGYLDLEKFEAGVIPRISVTFANTGKTPALDVRATAKVVIAPQPSPKLAESPDGLMIFPPSIPSIPAGSVFTLPAGERMGYFVEGTEVLTENTVEQIKKGQIFLVVFGIAWYKDGLENPHQLTFCMFYSANDDMFTACPEFNSTK